MQLNYRGSGGYGQEFLESGFLKWGTEMQDDLTDGALWAVNEGIVDKTGYVSMERVTVDMQLLCHQFVNPICTNVQ